MAGPVGDSIGADTMLKLTIGNKNYASACMPPWVLLRHAGIPFQEVVLPGAPRLPLLAHGDIAAWDTMAVIESLAEWFPERAGWPGHARRRARARSVCAEMHADLPALARLCPMNVQAPMPQAGCVLWRRHADLRQQVRRLAAMWSELLCAHAGPWLFGAFSAADAFAAPLCVQIRNYALPVPGPVMDYVGRMWALPAVQAWVKAALAEKVFVRALEPYRLDAQSGPVFARSALSME